ncbi:unnamed protein product [[Candida] boidinii]|nr:unnamed protein product [[Candida] boidinii]
MDIELDSRRESLKDYKKVERVVDSDRVIEYNEETGEETSELQYFVKWKRVNYDEYKIQKFYLDFQLLMVQIIDQDLKN